LSRTFLAALVAVAILTLTHPSSAEWESHLDGVADDTQDVNSTDAIVERIRNALRIRELEKHEHGIILKLKWGDEDQSGILLLLPDGRFRHEISITGSPFGKWISIYDGKTFWRGRERCVPSPIAPGEPRLQHLLLRVFLVYGIAFLDHAGVRFERVATSVGPPEDHVVLRASIVEDGPAFWLVVDHKSWLPAAICKPDEMDKPMYELSDYRAVDGVGVMFPHRTVDYKEDKGTESTLQARAAHASEVGTFSFHDYQPNIATFVQGAPSTLLVERAPDPENGPFLLIKPRINGQFVGWFLFDTGTNFSLISLDVANELDLELLDKHFRPNRNGDPGEYGWRHCKAFRLGPLKISELPMHTAPLNHIAKKLRRSALAGIIGADLLWRSVVELDLQNGRLVLHDANTFDGADLPWRTYRYRDQLICVPARFEGGHEALFMIDSGFDGFVDFEAEAVQRFGLLVNRETVRGRFFTFQGYRRHLEGTLDWFEFAGKRYERLVVTFNDPAEEEEDALEGTHVDCAGIVGYKLLKDFKVIFDCRRQRVAFVPHEVEPPMRDSPVATSDQQTPAGVTEEPPGAAPWP